VQAALEEQKALEQERLEAEEAKEQARDSLRLKLNVSFLNLNYNLYSRFNFTYAILLQDELDMELEEKRLLLDATNQELQLLEEAKLMAEEDLMRKNEILTTYRQPEVCTECTCTLVIASRNVQ